jgi:hypothetical protein
MTSRIGRAIRYWWGAISRPNRTLESFRVDSDRLVLSLWILLLFSVLYTITAFILYLRGIEPAIEPWIPIQKDRYYLYQTFWTIPWGLSTGIMMAGIAHILAAMAPRGLVRGTFEDSMMVNTIAWVIPSFILMWIPETFLAPFFKTMPWPDWVEMVRLSVLPPIWQTGLVAMGMRKTHHIGWLYAIVIGLIVVAVSFLMFLGYMR